MFLNPLNQGGELFSKVGSSVYDLTEEKCKRFVWRWLHLQRIKWDKMSSSSKDEMG